ncbi:MAG: hypothetical protein OXE87_08190 [Chloroflexi bacterium]|nr:hypothetical protein [Chloroflexota bacterium]
MVVFQDVALDAATDVAGDAGSEKEGHVVHAAPNSDPLPVDKRRAVLFPHVEQHVVGPEVAVYHGLWTGGKRGEMRGYSEPELACKSTPLGGEKVTEAVKRRREGQQVNRLRDAALSGVQEFAAGRQGRLIGSLPETPLQSGDLLDGLACLRRVNADTLRNRPHVSQVFQHQDEAVAVRVVIAVEQGGRPYVTERCYVPVEHIFPAVQRQPPAEPECHGIGTGQLDDDGSRLGRRAVPVNETTAVKVAEGVGHVGKLLDLHCGNLPRG